MDFLFGMFFGALAAVVLATVKPQWFLNVKLFVERNLVSRFTTPTDKK